tara:strand:- start:563 stop:916 length:354 start_codon:yes stop_codon:yes gene_type:complete
MTLTKQKRRLRIRNRIRKTIVGDHSFPRLSVFRSNKEIYAQIINDNEGKTIAHASSRDQKVKKNSSKSEISKEVGKVLAEKAISLGIKSVRFDRGGYLYHGRVKNLADGAREGGLKF